MPTRKRKLNGQARRPGSHLSRDDTRAFLKRLRKIRGSSSLNSMNHDLGFSVNQWYSYESGRSLPGLPSLAKIHKVRGVDLNWLVTGRR